jgi:hypothetical protein
VPDQINGVGPSVNDAPAPKADLAWVDRFVMQLTNQQVAPNDISKALADVRSHCADSGQSPQEAFGDPASYATTLAAELPPAPGRSFFNPRRIAALLPVTWGFAIGAIWMGADNRSEAAVSVGQLLLVTVAIPAWAVLTAPWARPRPRDPLRPHRPALDEKGWRGLWVTLGLFAVGAALWIGLDHTVFSVPKWVPLGLGLALIATGLLLTRLLAPRTPDPRTTVPLP